METKELVKKVAYSAVYRDQNCRWQRIPAIGKGFATKRELWAELYKAASGVDLPTQQITITTTVYHE